MMATMYVYEFVLTYDELSTALRHKLDTTYADRYPVSMNKEDRELRIEVSLPESNHDKARQMLVDLLRRDI